MYPTPVFIAGIKYPSLFDADLDGGLRSVSIWKALKRSKGWPTIVSGAFVAMESWVVDRVINMEGNQYVPGT